LNTALDILIVDDEEIVHATLGLYLRQLGHQIEKALDGSTASRMIEEREYDLALFDVHIPEVDGIALLRMVKEKRPEMTVVIITGYGTMDIAVSGLRLGATDFLTKPINFDDLNLVLEKAQLVRDHQRNRRRIHEKNYAVQSQKGGDVRRNGLIGKSAAIAEVRDQLRLAIEAGCDTILLSGETGTGKEVVAREIHFTASPEPGPFIAVSCPALPEALVESELFGHIKGSFTGAIEDRVGCFELANGGTLFLDEIADLSPGAQAKLLRALETRTVRRVGGAKETAINVRVVAATNVPLEALVSTKRFRQDLFYRLNAFTIRLAPLRERREDILPLAEYFLSSFSEAKGLSVAGLSKEAEAMLCAHSYPGNTRELKNLVERVAILRRDGWIEAQDIAQIITIMPSDPVSTEDMESGRIRFALERARWNRREAAKFLEMPYSTLRHKMRRYGID